jgi:plasmid stabilization system protein ParE
MAKSDEPGDERPLACVKSRRQVAERLREIKAYIDDQRGNDPNNETGWRELERIFRDLFFCAGGCMPVQVPGLSEHYRKRRVGSRYMVYYYVDEAENTMYLIELRHGSQKPLKPSTIRKYKGEIPDD